MASTIDAPDGVPYMPVDEMAEIEKDCSLSAALPWGGKYPGQVGLVQRDGHHVITPDGRRLADAHQRILCFSEGGHAEEVDSAIEATRKRFPRLVTADTSQYFEPATLLMKELHEALKLDGDYLIQLATTGTGANDQAIRLAMGALGGQENVTLVVLAGNYGGAGLYMNSVCEAAGWKGDTSLHSNAEVLNLDGSNMDEVFAKISKDGKKPILIAEDGVQGVGGFNVLDKRFMQEIYERVLDDGGLKIADNVQTFVRATEGKGMFGFNRWRAPGDSRHTPDFVTMAKGLGDGHSIGAVATLRHVAEQCAQSLRGPGNTFDTFSRNRDAIAAARTVLEIVQRENQSASVHTVGAELRAALQTVVDQNPGVLKAVVGMGGMTGLEFRDGGKLTDAMAVAPDKELTVAKGGSPTYPVMRLPLQFDATSEFAAEVAQKTEDAVKAVA